MSSSGLVIITDGDGIAAKVIAGCNGQQAQTLSLHIAAEKPASLEAIAELALRVHFGCAACLVVMDASRAVYAFGEDVLDQRYWDTYWNPKANPRYRAERDCGFEYSFTVNLESLIKEVS